MIYIISLFVLKEIIQDLNVVYEKTDFQIYEFFKQKITLNKKFDDSYSWDESN